MAQWGNTDDAANSVLWATTQVNLPANTTNQTALFGNTTPSAFLNNGVAVQREIGQFGVSVTEMNLAQSNAAIAQFVITNAGSGYAANAAVTVANTTGGSNTSIANSTQTLGRITAVTVNTTPGGYLSAPTVTIAAPAAINIVSNTAGFSNTTDVFLVATANSKFAVGDKIYYGVPAANTPIAPLTGNTYYYVQAANTTTIKLAATPGGAAIDLTDARNLASPETHTITGETAAAVSILSGIQHGAAHSGWVLRTVGQGGRAGRVQYETLVAMGATLTGDAENVVLPNA